MIQKIQILTSVYDIYPFQNLHERVTSFLKVLKNDQLQTTKTITVTLIVSVIELVLTWPATSNDSCLKIKDLVIYHWFLVQLQLT